VRPEPLLPIGHVWLAFGAHIGLLAAALLAVLRFLRSAGGPGRGPAPAPAPAVAVGGRPPAEPER
jgi:hypothetical protein